MKTFAVELPLVFPTLQESKSRMQHNVEFTVITHTPLFVLPIKNSIVFQCSQAAAKGRSLKECFLERRHLIFPRKRHDRFKSEILELVTRPQTVPNLPIMQAKQMKSYTVYIPSNIHISLKRLVPC